ncbi:alpha-2-macroglobulin family protein [Haliangium sp.]|uniref:alpha-2-macroglobulin family protein n=1 Tax=Haliangium sp. TaxID=2663208 RepID=UPI003D0B1F23
MTHSVKHPVDIEITDLMRAQAMRDTVRVGHYFVFADDRSALAPARPDRRGRLARLLLRPPAPTGGRVLALTDQPVDLAGVTLRPRDRGVRPMACLVSDRDLYRAEEDTVHLFAAMPAPRDDVSLVVTCHGEALTERPLQFERGVAMETLTALVPGAYAAELRAGGATLGQPRHFTVAAYALAPLAGRLRSHALDRAADNLTFELDVESYQLPFDGRLAVSLMDAGREVARKKLSPTAPGRYSGSLRMRGDGPFRLRLQAVDDAERVAEVTLPGSRAHERALTTVSELGTEMHFSLMPEPGALPVRGGYLSEGEVLATPITVDELVTDDARLHVRADIGDLTLIVLDLATARYTVTTHGVARAGDRIEVDTGGAAAAAVFVGALVGGRFVAGDMAGGQPFEAFTTFLRPQRLDLALDLPAKARPREALVLDLRTGVDEPVPVLVCVRDQRLTTADTPDKALGAALKAGVAAATAGMAEAGIDPLSELFEHSPWGPLMAHTRYLGMRTQSGVPVPAPPPSTVLRARAALPRAAAAPAQARGGSFDFEADALSEMRALAGSAPLEPEGMAMGALEQAEPDSGGVAKLFEADDEYGRFEAKPEPEPEAEPEPGPAREAFPELLFYGLVPVRGSEQLRIPLGDSLTTLAVEAFALHRGDWVERKAQVVVDQPVRADLELPPAIHPGDRVRGRLRVHVTGGRARVRLRCDDRDVPVRRPDGGRVEPGAVLPTPIELDFDAGPGRWQAEVEDVDGGERDRVEREVTAPGRIRHLVRELGLLMPGDHITLDSADALTLRVLPSVDQPCDQLVTATAGYAHLCCEQTAAKILSAVLMYLSAPGPVQRRQAEDIILSGIARERTMLRPGRGFIMYPNYESISDHYSRLAVRYLWNLDQLEALPEASPALREAARVGVGLADVAAQAHGMSRVPKQVSSIEDAYAAARAGSHTGAARSYIDRMVEIDGAEVRVREPRHLVADRAVLAYAAATLLVLGDLSRAVRIANVVTRQLGEGGGLYSTVDSVAAIALMIQLRSAGLIDGGGRVRVNGRELDTTEAAALSDQAESIEVIEGVAAVEVTRIVDEDWGAFSTGVPVKVGFRTGSNQRVKSHRPGDRVDLVVSLPQGYQVGDLAHVHLPPAMAWIEGGGKVQRFSRDFEGKNELRVPVLVTAPIDGRQRFAVCVRNMFEEERAGSPGLIEVKGRS